MKAINTFSVDEVCQWLVAIGLGSHLQGFQDNQVDGSLLVTLTDEDLKTDLGLSGLQAKRVLNEIQEFQALTTGNDEEYAKLLQQIESLKEENRILQQKLAAATPKPPAAAAAPPKKQPQQPAGAPVIREGAKGAARGAVLGAIGGAIAGDAAKGAKIGAAVGGTGGALRGVGARRRRF